MAVVLHGFHKDLYGVLEEVTASAWVFGMVSGFSTSLWTRLLSYTRFHPICVHGLEANHKQISLALSGRS